MSHYSSWGCLKEKAGSGDKCVVCRTGCPFYLDQSEDEVNLLADELERMSKEIPFKEMIENLHSRIKS